MTPKPLVQYSCQRVRKKPLELGATWGIGSNESLDSGSSPASQGIGRLRLLSMGTSRTPATNTIQEKECVARTYYAVWELGLLNHLWFAVRLWLGTGARLGDKIHVRVRIISKIVAREADVAVTSG